MTVKLECKHKEDGDARAEQTRNLLGKNWKLSSFLVEESNLSRLSPEPQSFRLGLDLIPSSGVASETESRTKEKSRN